MNLNKVFLIGRLTADPQIRQTPAGQAVGTFSVATNRNWTGKDGQKKEETQFHNVVVWGRQAEIAGQFLKKGSMVMVEGRLQTRAWKDAKGENRRTTEVITERIQLGPRAYGVGGGGNYGAKSAGEASAPQEQEDPKEELPEINLDENDIKPENIPF